MICSFCNREMEKGYITTDARAVAWRKEKSDSAIVRKDNGVQLAHNPLGGAAVISNAYCCKHCQKILIDYSE